MAQDIQPGTKVTVKVVKTPTNEAARKTIVRLLSKDADVKQENARLERARRDNLRHEQRGGRQWAVRVVKQHPVKGVEGEIGTILATMDVIRDLGSVSRFVEVAAA